MTEERDTLKAEIARLREALAAIDQTAFIGTTNLSAETKQVALESIHDIASAAIAERATNTLTDSGADVERAITRRMIEFYNRNPVFASTFIDEQIDRSGNLLGWIRDAALRSSPDERQ